MKFKGISGFRDYLLEEARLRQEIIGIFKKISERYGFTPTETPAVERLDLLIKDKEDLDVIIYEVRGSKERGESDKGLRYDLTVPLSRIVGTNFSRLPKIFKRYQVGTVWRGEKPQAGRYREFTQCDLDIVGTKNVIADSELIGVIDEFFKKLGIKDYRFRINNRKVFNGLPKLAGFNVEILPNVLRILDKFDKIGKMEVYLELVNLELKDDSIEKIMNLITIQQGHGDVLSKLTNFSSGNNNMGEGLEELWVMGKYLDTMGVSRENWCYDTGIVRGLMYYTGPIFETTLTSIEDIGSVCSGGRYDNLIYAAGQYRPATGISIGLDRLCSIINNLNIKVDIERVPTIVVIPADSNGLLKCIEVLKIARNNGISSTLFPEIGKVKNGLTFANSINAKYVCLIGEDEIKENKVTVKNLESGEQIRIDFEDTLDCGQLL